MNILFICSRNQWRSRTCETIYQNHPVHRVRSAGTSKNARVVVNEKMIEWADLIFVMEKRHRDLLEERFPESVANKDVVVLEVADEYEYMDPELVSFLKELIDPYLAEQK